MADLKISELNRNWEFLRNYSSSDDNFIKGTYFGNYLTYQNKTENLYQQKEFYIHDYIKDDSIWTDGENIYGLSNYINPNSTYDIYKYIGYTWSNVSKSTSIATDDLKHRVWQAGNKTYYTAGSKTYEFDKTAIQWKTSTITNASSIDDGKYIWHDAVGNVYYSKGSTQYKFDVAQNKWVSTTWNVSSINGDKIWNFLGNTYFNFSHELDPSDNQWKGINWTSSDGLIRGSKTETETRYELIRYDYVWNSEKQNYEQIPYYEWVTYTSNTSYYPNEFVTYAIGNTAYLYIKNRTNYSDIYRNGILWDSSSTTTTMNKIYSTNVLSIGANVATPVNQSSLTWKIGSTTGPNYRATGLKWAGSGASQYNCSEYKVSDASIADSGYLYLSDNSQRVTYNSNKQIKYARSDLQTYYPLWTTGQIENRAVTENKTRYIIFNGNKRYIADSPTATSGTNLTYKSIGYYDGSGGSLSERHWISQSSNPYNRATYYEIYVMNSTYLSYEYRLSGKSIPNAYNLKSMTFTIPKPSGVTSATYTNAKLYDYDVYINGVPGTTEGHAKYKSFSLSSDGTFVINFNSALTSGTWYIKKLVFQVYETTVKNKW